DGVANFDDANAGPGKTVTFSGFALGGSAAGNYELTGQPANVTAAITAATLTVTPDAGQTKIYGSADLPLAYTATGWQYGEDETLLSGALSRDADNDVGTYDITQGTLYETSGNYVISFTPNVTFSITPKPQTITFNPAAVLSLEDGTYTLAASTEDGVTVKFRIDGSAAAASTDAADNTLLHLIQSGSVTVTAYIDDTNYAAAEASRTLTIVSGNTGVLSVTVSNAALTSDNIYLANCGAQSVEISVTPAVTGSQVIHNGTAGNIFTVALPRADIYHVAYTVQSSDGSAQEYALQVESRFAFDDIIGAKFNNVLFVNNNPSNNGGYTFTDYEWFKDGQSIGSGQYYSAGPTRSDLLDATAAYSVTLTTQDGKALHVCPGSVTLRASSLQVYPNPVRLGEEARLESSAPDNSIIRIYDLHGRLVGTQQLNGGAARVHLPQTIGIYLITVGNETIKVSVTE
ncbi:MAG: T9SS type A sorting domain-containing protein, partial [Bacteroidales bacterium]|nr:T9SS type A sorting domain-containing protein [Bacteroidales bacterium]